ncbi:MAG: tRNA (adenosine(37)-N6)-threonylcarbamoyltransferase complex dimerization subunit type 1 TsaB [Pseudomonadota bacterium]
MRVLAIETASEACSVALFDGGHVIAHDHRVLGRGHAEHLIVMIGALPQKGRADQILVSLGPGSFTGVRVGLAAARALGIAWGATVLGYPTLALIAAMARTQEPDDPGAVTVCVNGGHGEWFVADFDAEGLQQAPVVSLRPEAAALRPVHARLAGNRAKDLAAQLANEELETSETLPDARWALRLPEACLTGDLTPIYGRAPDATPQKLRKAV